jgi:tyrosine-protein kinase Etk/Wzc
MSEQRVNNMQPIDGSNADDEIYFLDLLIVLARYKKLVIGMPIITGTLALAISLQMTPIFTSIAKIMPPQQQQSSGVAAMLGQLGGLAGAAGIKSPNDLYVGLLESRTVADNLIKRFKLKERYAQTTMDATRNVLASVSAISNDKKSGFISISANDKDPKFAADLANAYADELAKLTLTMALTEASQRRLFFEKQLKDARDQLANAEVALRNTQEKTGMIQPDAQVHAIIANVAQLKGTIAAKEVQLNAIRTFAAVQNPELLRTQEELRGLQAQLKKLEKNQPSKEGDFMVPTGKLPEVGVEYVRGVRNVKYYETIFELLAKQFELAKIDEAKDSSLIQLLDKAIPAEHKSKPSRAMITLTGLFGGGVLGILLAFMHAAYIGSRQNPESSRQWQQLSLAWKRSAHE